MDESSLEVFYDVGTQKWVVLLKLDSDPNLSDVFQDDVAVQVDNLMMSALGY